MHHHDGKLEEVEYNYATTAVNASVDSLSCLKDAQREELRSEIEKILSS